MYTSESGAALEAALEAAKAQLGAYVDHVRDMHGGSAEMPGLYAAREQLQRAIKDFNDRAFDHTGTTIDVDWDDEEFEGVTIEVSSGQVVSVVSRWDLLVDEHEELLAEGRAAHRRNRPEETDDDADVAITTAPHALYAILHENSEPWFDLPGMRFLAGARLYVLPNDGVVEPPPDDPNQLQDWVAPPPGPIPFSEAW